MGTPGRWGHGENQDPVTQNSIAEEKFKVFRIGLALEGEGATKHPLTNAFGKSHQNLLDKLAKKTDC